MKRDYMQPDYMRWGQANREDDRQHDYPPTVTIFGAGISGLTAAHELIERGFNVNVVEPAWSPAEEYACQVGGVAANQVGRVKIDADAFQRMAREIKETSDPDKNKDLGVFVKAERAVLMQPVQHRFPIVQRIQFDKCNPTDSSWTKYLDDYGVSNAEKLRYIAHILNDAWDEYYCDYNIQFLAVLRALIHGDLKPTLAKVLPLPGSFIEAIKENPKLLFDVLRVRVLGYTDGDGDPKTNREISKRWAELVAQELSKVIARTFPKTQITVANFSSEGRGGEAPLGNQVEPHNRHRSNRVEFQIFEQPIPGEHGYRFFPNFYRHIFDTMKRTPVFDKHGDITSETAYDQLVPTLNTAIAFNDGKGLNKVELRRFTSIKAIQDTIEFFRSEAKFTDRDLLRLQVYFLKYMTSCPERRTAEAEEVSFWRYVHADGVKYSSAAARFLDGAPQALVAMSAKETDARTQYNALIQMLLQNPIEPFVPDMQLNGTTSEAWLNRWKDYLKRKGVKFFIGKLTKLIRNGDGFLPVIGSSCETEVSDGLPLSGIIPEDLCPPWESKTDRDAAQADLTKAIEASDFFVMAIPLDAASELVWDACASISSTAKISGPFQQLMEFDVYTGRRDRHGRLILRKRSPSGRPADGDPQRDISGVQFFIPQNYRIGEGYVYYPESSWALSSISQLAFWRERVSPIGKYIG